nr:hypothetical protein [uncultured archaeon]AQS29498.1 hypothetical protein [uncultured archaeon]
MKIAIYLDGSNFYFSVKNTFKCKIDIQKFCKKLVGENQLVSVKYYTAPIDKKSNPKGYVEQQKFFEKIKQIEKLNIILGRLERHKKDGKVLHVEKATDINLALDLVLDAVDNKYDKAYLISNDGDFSGAVSEIIKRFNKKIVYVAVGNRKTISYHLMKVASSTFKITKDFINEVKLE